MKRRGPLSRKSFLAVQRRKRHEDRQRLGIRLSEAEVKAARKEAGTKNMAALRASLTPEQWAANSRKGWEALTPEQQHDARARWQVGVARNIEKMKGMTQPERDAWGAFCFGRRKRKRPA